MRSRFQACLAGALCALSLLLMPQALALPLATATGCRIFPSSNPWNQRADGLPVHSNSRALITSIGRDDGLHPDFGSGQWQGGPIGIPFVTVPGSQRKVGVRFHYADESDPGPYPIPRNAPIEGGANSEGDRHVIVVDRSRCRLYELFDPIASKTPPAGKQAPEQPGASAPTACGRRDGRRPTQQACRSFLGWFATTRSDKGASIMPCASRLRARAAPMFIRLVTLHRATPTWTFLRWGNDSA